MRKQLIVIIVDSKIKELILNKIINDFLINSKLPDSINRVVLGDKFENNKIEEIFLELYNKYNSGYPLDYILNKINLNNISFFIKEGVFIPRPCSQQIVDNILSL